MLLAIFVIGVIIVVNSTRRLLTFKVTANNVARAEERLERLRAQNEELKRELAYKQSPEFVEREIREKLGLVRRGEAIVILPKGDDESLDKLGTSLANDERKSTPNYKKWWRLFFGS